MAEDLQLKMYISARTEALALGLQKAEDMTKQTMQRMNKLQATPGGGVGAGGLSFQGGELIGGLAKGVVGIAALQAGLQLAHGVVKGMRGDWEGMEQVVRSLPGGLGMILGTAIDIRREFEGTREQAEKLLKVGVEFERAGKAMSQFRAGGGKLRDENLRGERVAAGGEEAGLRFDRFSAMKQVHAEAAFQRRLIDLMPAQAHGQPGVTNEERAQMYAKVLETERAREAEIEAAHARNVEALKAKQAAAAEDLRTKELDKEKQLQERMADLQGKYRVQELESQGKELDARLQAIENSYRQRIEAAEAGERELLQKIANEEKVAAVSLDNQRREQERQQERAKEYDLQARAEEQAKARIAQTVSALQSQSLSAEDAGFLTRGTGTDRSTEIATEQLRVQEESKRILDEVRRDLRKRQQFVEVGFGS